MHPAPSVILFSTLSGLGFGLLAWLGFGAPDVIGMSAFGMYLLGYALAVGGLLASAFHLAKPSNAYKSFSQWRSSWLSREAILAVVALLLVAPVAFAKVFLGSDPAVLGALGALLCLATVVCTAMIYAQLRTVPRWNSPATPILFLAYAVAGGAILAGQTTPAIAFLALAAVIQVGGWTLGDRRFAESGATPESATGLQDLGVVRQLEPPHSGSNYLLKEMAYVVGRKHAVKLRFIGATLAFVLPILLLLTGSFVGLALAAISHLAGVLAIRWLFFAEAQHVVSLYYGHRDALA